jgi:Sigma-70 region 2
MPLFDRLYNFAHWLTQDRQEAEAEDLVQETYVKALKGFRPSGEQTFAPGSPRFCVTPRLRATRQNRGPPALLQVIENLGGGGWTRTNDLRIMRPSL